MHILGVKSPSEILVDGAIDKVDAATGGAISLTIGLIGLAVALILIGMCCCYCMFCGKDAWIYNCRDKDGDEKDTKDSNVEGGQPKDQD